MYYECTPQSWGPFHMHHCIVLFAYARCQSRGLHQTGCTGSIIVRLSFVLRLEEKCGRLHHWHAYGTCHANDFCSGNKIWLKVNSEDQMEWNWIVWLKPNSEDFTTKKIQDQMEDHFLFSAPESVPSLCTVLVSGRIGRGGDPHAAMLTTSISGVADEWRRLQDSRFSSSSGSWIYLFGPESRALGETIWLFFRILSCNLFELSDSQTVKSPWAARARLI